MLECLLRGQNHPLALDGVSGVRACSQTLHPLPTEVLRCRCENRLEVEDAIADMNDQTATRSQTLRVLAHRLSREQVDRDASPG